MLQTSDVELTSCKSDSCSGLCSAPGLSSLALRRALVEGQAPQGELCCLLVSLGLCTRKLCSGTDPLCHRGTKESSRLFLSRPPGWE